MPVFIGLIFVFTPAALYIVSLGSHEVLWSGRGHYLPSFFHRSYSLSLRWWEEESTFHWVWIQITPQLLLSGLRCLILRKHNSLVWLLGESDSDVYVMETMETIELTLWPTSFILYNYSSFIFTKATFSSKHFECSTLETHTYMYLNPRLVFSAQTLLFYIGGAVTGASRLTPPLSSRLEITDKACLRKGCRQKTKTLLKQTVWEILHRSADDETTLVAPLWPINGLQCF